MFGTPDFGHSDIWHFNFPIKFFLGEALKAGHLPAWSKDIGTGFPMLAEGQMGVGNLYNLIAFRLLDPVLAFNLGFVVIFLTAGIGSYLFARAIKLSKLSALFLAIIFPFSGVFVTQIVHFNLIQAGSFLPLEFFLAEKYFQTNKKRFLLLFTLVLSQQIYSGFQQMVLISLIGVAIYSLIRRRPFALILPVILGVLLALPQLLISSQLIKESFRTGGVAIAEMIKYAFPPVHLLSFLNPFIFGDPHYATYPGFSYNWGIFWESTGYLGIIPIILVFLNAKRFKKDLVFWVIFIVSLILLLGKATPFFFLFQLPPLSLFRVPARFLLLFVWSLAVLATISLNRLKSNRLKIIILAITVLDLGIFFFKSNAVINPKVWLAKPESVVLLQKDQSWYRISSFFSYFPWNNVYLKTGWQNMNDFLPLRNNLDPNQNLLWQVPSADVYAGLVTRRIETWRSLLNAGIAKNYLSDSSIKLLSLSGVKYIFTPWPIDKLELVATVSAKPQVLMYKNSQSLPHAYLTRNFETVSTLDQLKQKMVDANNTAVILEKEINLATASGEVGTAVVTTNEDQEVVISTVSDQPALLILADSYFPGWEVFIDGKQAEIMPANLNQRAVIVPQGNHSVRFSYQPFALRNILPLLHL